MAVVTKPILFQNSNILFQTSLKADGFSLNQTAISQSLADIRKTMETFCLKCCFQRASTNPPSPRCYIDNFWQGSHITCFTISLLSTCTVLCAFQATATHPNSFDKLWTITYEQDEFSSLKPRHWDSEKGQKHYTAPKWYGLDCNPKS